MSETQEEEPSPRPEDRLKASNCEPYTATELVEICQIIEGGGCSTNYSIMWDKVHAKHPSRSKKSLKKMFDRYGIKRYHCSGLLKYYGSSISDTNRTDPPAGIFFKSYMEKKKLVENMRDQGFDVNAYYPGISSESNLYPQSQPSFASPMANEMPVKRVNLHSMVPIPEKLNGRRKREKRTVEAEHRAQGSERESNGGEHNCSENNQTDYNNTGEDPINAHVHTEEDEDQGVFKGRVNQENQEETARIPGKGAEFLYDFVSFKELELLCFIFDISFADMYILFNTCNKNILQLANYLKKYKQISWPEQTTAAQ